MLTKEECVERYLRFKSKTASVKPKLQEFLQFSGISQRELETVFGSRPYSKLQELAGDRVTRLETRATPLEEIMKQYGQLVEDMDRAPPASEWTHRKLRPSESGLGGSPHNIKWSEMPKKFLEWLEESKSKEFSIAKTILGNQATPEVPAQKNQDLRFQALVDAVKGWMPARGRNSEETYKVELRGWLSSGKKFEIAEEQGESNFDLLVDNKYPIEMKKDPSNHSDFDRLFGQIARHLENKKHLIILILDAKRGDKLDMFSKLVDKYFNLEATVVTVVVK